MPETPQSQAPLQVTEADLFAQIGRLVVENQALRALLAQARQAIESQQTELKALDAERGILPDKEPEP